MKQLSMDLAPLEWLLTASPVLVSLETDWIPLGLRTQRPRRRLSLSSQSSFGNSSFSDEEVEDEAISEARSIICAKKSARLISKIHKLLPAVLATVLRGAAVGGLTLSDLVTRTSKRSAMLRRQELSARREAVLACLQQQPGLFKASQVGRATMVWSLMDPTETAPPTPTPKVSLTVKQEPKVIEEAAFFPASPSSMTSDPLLSDLVLFNEADFFAHFGPELTPGLCDVMMDCQPSPFVSGPTAPLANLLGELERANLGAIPAHSDSLTSSSDFLWDPFILDLLRT